MSGINGLADEDEKKPIVQSTHITIKVNVHQREKLELFFRIKRNTKLKKLVDACCDRQSLEKKLVDFLIDGTRLREEQTPDELEMEEGDEIDVMLHHDGGGI
ncbi:hypothetical protein LXL04_026315 [Taraxacum kok-saghyz]